MNLKTELPHPHKIMAELVNNYEKIKPFIENGEVRRIEFLIGETVERGNDYHNDFRERILSLSKRGSYARWRIALQYLTGLSSKLRGESEIDPIAIKNVFHSLDRQIAELDFILYKYPEYKLYRESS